VSDSSPEISFRPVSPDDIMDVVDWWTGSFRRSKWAGTIPNNKFREVQGELIRQLISRGAKCLLAVNKSNEAQVLGFICTEKTKLEEPVVHYIFVKDYYRRHGISKLLLEAAGIPVDGTAFYTHKTAFSKHYRGKHVPEIARRKDA
jgi:hypothetical protein